MRGFEALEEDDDDCGEAEVQKKKTTQWEEEKGPDQDKSSVLDAIGLSPGVLE